MALLCVGASNAWGQTSYTNGSAVAEGGEYFLYNIGAGKFLDNGSDYNTRAVVDNSGQELTLAAIDAENGIYTVYTGLGSGYFTGAWMDAISTQLTFEELAINPTGYTGKVYKIKNGENYSVYNTDAGMWHADAYKSSAQGTAVDLLALSGTNNDYWLLIPKSVRQAAGDYTYLMKEASFNWTSSSAWNNTNSSATLGGLITNLCYEAYNKTFDVYQYNTGLTNGVYRVKVTGFYRNGTNYNADDDVNSCLYATGYSKVTANLPLIITGGNASILYENTTGGSTWMTDTKQGDVYVPNSQNGASAYIANGNYDQTTVDVYVNNGGLTVGVKCDYNVANSWTVFDEFELEYLGNSLMQDAAEFTSGGSLTADTWYFFDIPRDANYTITAGSALANIVYTTDGTMATSVANANVSANFSGLQALTKGRVYFKSSSVQTLTFAETNVSETYSLKLSPVWGTDSYTQATGGGTVYLLDVASLKERLAISSGTWGTNSSGNLNRFTSNTSTGYLSVLYLNADDIFTISFHDNNGNANAVSAISTNMQQYVNGEWIDVTAGTVITSGTKYRMKSSGNADLKVTTRNIYFSQLTVSTVHATVTRPTIAVEPGFGHANITLTGGSIRGNGSGTVKVKYSYTSADDAVSSGSEYTTMLAPTSSGTIYTCSYVNGVSGSESDAVSATYSVTPTLPTPIATPSAIALTQSGTGYYKTYTLACDLSGIDGSESIDITYKYSTDQSEWNDVDGTSLLVVGTYYIKATAENCNDSEVLEVNATKYIQTSSYDFTTASTFRAYEDNYTSVNGITFAKTPNRASDGMYYSGSGNSGNVSVTHPLEGQIISVYRKANTTPTYYTEWREYDNGTLYYYLTRYSSNNNYHHLQNYKVYTPESLVATSGDVTVVDGNVDLTGKVIYSENIDAIKTAIAALEGVKTISIYHVGGDITAAQLNGLIPAALKNTAFIQLPENSYYEAIADVANLRTNAGNVAKFDLADTKNYGVDTEFTPTAATYDRSFAKDVVSTICLPFAISAETAATLGKFYQLKSTTTTSTVVFEEVDATDALKPYLFVPAATGTITIPAGTTFVAAGDVTTQTYNNVNFNGSIASSTISGTIYGFASDGSFVTADEGTMNPFRAYLTVSNGARLASWTIGDITGIDAVQGSEFMVNDSMQDGKFVINGQLVIKKNGKMFNAAGAQMK